MAGRGLVTEAPDRFGWRSDPGQPGVDDGLGEVGVFRQEAVSGVDGVGAAGATRVENLVDPQVRITRRAAGEGVRFVRDAYVQGVDVGLRVHGDAGIPGVAACPGNPDSDLSPVGNEDLTHVSPVLVQRG